MPRTQQVLAPPTSGVFPPLSPGMLASSGTREGTHWWQHLCHVLFNPDNPKSPGGSGVVQDGLLLNKTQAILPDQLFAVF